MKTNNLLLLLFSLLLLGCQKDFSESNLHAETNDKSISLKEAIDMMQRDANKLHANSLPSPASQQYAAPRLQADILNNTNSTDEDLCPSYPVIRDFSSRIGIDTEGTSHSVLDGGGGIALRHKFKKGMTYQITFYVSSENVYNGDKPKLTKFPNLEFGLANQQHFPVNCNGHIKLSSLQIPSYVVQTIPGQSWPQSQTTDVSINSHARTITLVANECYDFLWLNVIPVSGKYWHKFGISNLVIKELGDGFNFVQTGKLENDGAATFQVNYSGYLIDHPWHWETTGNLVIQGDNIGASVNIKSTNSDDYSGTIRVTLPGCGVILEKVIERCSGKLDGTSIDAPSMAIWGQEYTIKIIPPQVDYEFETTVTLERNLGRAQFTKIDDFKYKLKVHTLNPYPGMPDYGEDFIIDVKYKNECNKIESMRLNIKAPNSINPGPGGIE